MSPILILFSKFYVIIIHSSFCYNSIQKELFQQKKISVSLQLVVKRSAFSWLIRQVPVLIPIFCGAVPFPVLRQTVVSGMAARAFPHRILRYLDPAWNHEQVEAKHHGSPFSKAEFDQALQDMGTTYYPNRRGIDFYHTYKQDLACCLQKWA